MNIVQILQRFNSSNWAPSTISEFTLCEQINLGSSIVDVMTMQYLFLVVQVVTTLKSVCNSMDTLSFLRAARELEQPIIGAHSTRVQSD